MVSLDSQQIAEPNETNLLKLLILLKVKPLPKHSVRLEFHENSSYGKATKTVSLESRQIAKPKETNLLKLKVIKYNVSKSLSTNK